MRDSYTFTIVTAAYNVEQYLDEAVQSILDQDIGFVKHVQLILVDDGSTDATPAICDRYAAKYPENIQVIHKEQGGVSAARNAGMHLIRGDYVNFLDSDDKLSRNTLGLVYQFLQEHGSETNVTTIPIMFFEGRKGEHYLNKKFQKGTRVINLEKEPFSVQMSMSTSFIKKEALEGMQFDTELRIGEDATFMQNLLLARPMLGVVKEACYWYRRRTRGSSAMQNSLQRSSDYLVFLDKFVFQTVERAKRMYGCIPRFLQFALAADLQWRYVLPEKTVRETLTPEDTEKWREMMYACLDFMEDGIINHMATARFAVRMHLLCKKKKLRAECRFRDGAWAIWVGDVRVMFINTLPVRLNFLKDKGDYAELSGCVTIPDCNGLENLRIALLVEGKPVECEIYREEKPVAYVLGSPCEHRVYFTGRIPLKKEGSDFTVHVALHMGGNHYCILGRFESGRFFPLAQGLRRSYCVIGRHIVSYMSMCLKFRRYGIIRHASRELHFMRKLISGHPAGGIASVFIRALYWLTKPFMPNDIWLFSDRINKADDNGEALFRYVVGNKLHKHSYYVINKSSKDFPRLKKIGKVLPYMGVRNLLYHLHAEMIISSHADAHVSMYAKPKRARFFMDLLNKRKFIFLQHGPTLNDMSYWLSARYMDMDMFVTCDKSEYHSIADSPKYAYGPEVVKLTGMPRFDGREDRTERIITFAPTWRQGMATRMNPKTGEWVIDPEEFKKSDYYRFFHGLLTNERLLAAAREHGYRLWFVPHPNMIALKDLFQFDGVEVKSSIETSYSELYSRSALMVTDYSSSVMDFAYMRKPIVYTQFDKDTFMRKYSTADSYYDYENDGFGDVAYDLDAAVEVIVNYMQTDCRLKDKYRDRINEYFVFADRHNCERVYNEIVKKSH